MPKRRSEQTGKVSITVAADDLKLLRARAKRLHDGNLSAAVADGVRWLREEEATVRLLERLGAPPLAADRYREILAEWSTEAKPPKKGARKQSAA